MGGLIRLLVLAVVVWLLISGVRRLFLLPSFPRRDQEEEKKQAGLSLVQDPQSGRFVLERDVIRASHEQGLYVWSQECRDRSPIRRLSRGKRNPE